ncbi:type III polyketide synthase [Micromonospora sp. NBC_01813]|uniref:type III polyketide synthase n=1 Tax=Micromonospora sp. NBC_01813 TaxID=2975988 RepID=UPI002DD9590E|nr:type III polyketide synthase [Micromonospora sp. NBC_01813]WSA12291.1 type III polyketide synthase [Micromonospora sp. NBC_01813]
MPVLCKPAVAVPEFVVTLDETLELTRQVHAGHTKLSLALRLIGNTGVLKRHIVQPLQETLKHPGLTERTQIYVEQAIARIPPVAQEAMHNADLRAVDIDAIAVVSCTGFTMPPLSTWMINKLGFRLDTVQIPIAQLGCAAGGAAIGRAYDYSVAHPGSNVLIVACEFCSLGYQPTDLQVGNLLSNGLFGDAVAAVVVAGRDRSGLVIERVGSRLVPDTQDWISYLVKETGFHFLLDKRVPATMKQLAPELKAFVSETSRSIDEIDHFVIHAGGPRILDDLSLYLGIDAENFDVSRRTLREYGNIASAVVLDVLRRKFDEAAMVDGETCLLAGFGPGITAEMMVGTWQ